MIGHKLSVSLRFKLTPLATFNCNQQIMVELKNCISCHFSECESAFEFFMSFNKNESIRKVYYNEFEKAVNSLTSHRFKKEEIKQLWQKLTENGKTQYLDLYAFRSNFEALRYTGKSTMRSVKSAGKTTIITASSATSAFESDVFEKLKGIIKSSNKSLAQVFREFDSDGNGRISQVEFRSAIRKLNLGLTSREIDKVMFKFDTNGDGLIDWQEFVSKFTTK